MLTPTATPSVAAARSAALRGWSTTGAERSPFSPRTDYTGATTINAGTLLVNGTLGNTAVTINGGATLAATAQFLAR